MTTDNLEAKKFLLFISEKEKRENQSEIQDLKLKISSEKIKYILWSTSAVILILFLAKRLKMIN
tara:strand:+ start:2856 stop:3047 length:192 start_codon:yes stop_codon:yes gene_type:complete